MAGIVSFLMSLKLTGLGAMRALGFGSKSITRTNSKRVLSSEQGPVVTKGCICLALFSFFTAYQYSRYIFIFL